MSDPRVEPTDETTELSQQPGESRSDWKDRTFGLHYGAGPSGIEQRLSQSQPRPKWAEAIRLFVGDGIVAPEYEYPEDGTDDWLLDLVDEAVNNIFCNAYGHEIVDDQCGISEHRYCVYCQKRWQP